MPAKTTKTSTKKPRAKAIAKKTSTKKPTTSAKKSTASAKKATAPKKIARAPKKKNVKSATPAKPGPRADFGSPVDGYFAARTGPLAEVLTSLRALVDRTVPGITGSLKWGMPVYELDGTMICAMRATGSYVRLILSGGPELFVDPEGLLEGEGKTGRHLKLRPGAPIPARHIETWLLASRDRA